MLEMGNENPKMNFIVAFGIGLAFSMYDNELQRQMVERIEIDEDLEFYRNFADGFAFGFDADSESREKLSQLVNDDTKASSILGFGVGRNYSEIQLDTIKEVSVLVGQSEHFAYNMGRGASMVIEDFDKKIKKQLLQTAKDYPAFAKGLGQINHS